MDEKDFTDRQRSLTIVAVGDVALNGRYHAMLPKRGAYYPLRLVGPLWQGADIRLGNLESPITTAPRSAPEKCTLRGSPLTGECLEEWGMSLVNLANNHMMDYGKRGLEDTIANLEQVNVSFLGAGPNKQLAGSPLTIEKKGQVIGFLSFCDVEQRSPLYASANQAGVNFLHPNECIAGIGQLKKTVDWLVVNVHWGMEMTLIPSPRQRALARKFVAAGADLILGHHPHVIQPMETLDRSVVFYSLGTFLFSDMYWRGVNRDGEAFVSRLRLHPLSRLTGWAEVSLSTDKGVKARLRTARLKRDLSVAVDDRRCRDAQLESQHDRLASLDYDREYDAEVSAARKRTAWRWAWKPLHRRLELKLFHHGLMPHAVEGN